MRREIAEQPRVMARLFDEERPAVRALARRLRRREPHAIVIAARGSSDNAALYARYLIETRLDIPVSLAAPSVVTLYGARLRLRGAVAVGLSQSGESPDIVEFIRAARGAGALTVGITNNQTSPLALAAHETLRLRAGRERSIAATKTYTAQLYLLSLLVAEMVDDLDLVADHADLPAVVEQVLRAEDAIKEAARRWRQVDECIVTSRGYNYATAREAALKLKETCYMVAEPLSSSDLLHGPIAVVERGFPVLLIAAPGRAAEHLGDVLLRLRRRRAQTTVLASEPRILRSATVPIPVPASVDETLSPHVYVLPLQLLAYHLSLARGLDPDRPRGLRKVTRVR